MLIFQGVWFLWSPVKNRWHFMIPLTSSHTKVAQFEVPGIVWKPPCWNLHLSEEGGVSLALKGRWNDTLVKHKQKNTHKSKSNFLFTNIFSQNKDTTINRKSIMITYCTLIRMGFVFSHEWIPTYGFGLKNNRQFLRVSSFFSVQRSAMVCKSEIIYVMYG